MSFIPSQKILRNHQFYSKPKRKRTGILLMVAGVTLVIVSIGILIGWITQLYFISALVLWICLSIVAPFIDVPSLEKSGGLIYYSLLFLTEKPKNGIIKIHGGTLFDYVFVIQRNWNGKQRTVFILQQFLDGLLNLIEQYEKGKNQHIKVQGTSYILNMRTAEKLGFSVVTTHSIQNLILLFNFPNVFVCNSIAKAKLAVPNILRTQTFEADLTTLILNKEKIKVLRDRMIQNKE